MAQELPSDVEEAWGQLTQTAGLRGALLRVPRQLQEDEEVIAMAGGRLDEAQGLSVATTEEIHFVTRVAATSLPDGLPYSAIDAAELFEEDDGFTVDLTLGQDTMSITRMEEPDAAALVAVLTEEIAAAKPKPPVRAKRAPAKAAAMPVVPAAAAASSVPAPPAPVPPTLPPLSPRATARAEKAYRKAARPLWRKKRFLLPLALVVLIVLVVVSINNNNKKVVRAAEATCVGKSYPDQQNKDICADAAGSVTLAGLSVTATPLKAQSDTIGGKALCSTVTIKNQTSSSQDYNELDFKIQKPSGDVATGSTLSLASTLSSGTLIKGASKTGLVCGDDTGERGTYVFIYKPNFIEGDRGIWLFPV